MAIQFSTIRRIVVRADFWLIVIFLGLLIAPELVWNEMDEDFRQRKLVSENRPEAKPVRFTWRRFRRFPEAYSAYFNDHFAFREYLLYASQAVSAQLNNRFSPRVIVGQDEMLFMKDRTGRNSDTSEDYLAKELWTTPQLRRIVAKLEHARIELKKLGVEFYVIVPPNKMSVYGDMLPEKRRYQRAPLLRAEQLIAGAKRYAPELKITFMDAAFAEARRQTEKFLFIHEDTHWNGLGAYVGARELMRLMDPACRWPELKDAQIVPTKPIVGGDLRLLLGHGTPRERPDYTVTLPGETPVTVVQRFADDYRVQRSVNPGAPDARRVWVYRDSFVSAMMPYLSGHFRQIDYFWNIPIRRGQFAKVRPDIVVFEMLERQVRKLDEFDFESRRKVNAGFFQE